MCGKSAEGVCADCLSSAPPAERECAEWIFPVFDYRDKTIKQAVWLLKYKGKKNLARVFAENIYGRMLEELSDLEVMENFTHPILIPIPLDNKRWRERGFNQVELICRELMRLDQNKNWEMKNDCLIKIKDAEHQARIENRSARLKNIVGSFTVPGAGIQAIKNRNIILIDDVTTTGATLGEARKTLLNAGAKKVIAFTVAH